MEVAINTYLVVYWNPFIKMGTLCGRNVRFAFAICLCVNCTHTVTVNKMMWL